VNVIEAELASQKKELLNPETAKESYGRRAREMQGAADWLRLQGANDAADDYSTGAMKLLDNALAADKTSKGQRIQTWKPELTNNASVPGPSLVFNTVTEMYTGKYTDADGNIQEISVPQVSDLGLVTDIGTGGPRGLLSEKEMTNVKGYFEAEGIVAGLHSDAVRPKMQKMGTYIKKIHKMMGGGEDTRQEAKIMTIEKIQEFEAAYWDEVDAWKALSNKEKIQVWKASGHVVTKGKTKYQQMKDYYYNGNFNPAVRALLQDDKMMAYRPNETTRKQTKGTTR
jgi:hypothetical protein